MTTANSDALRKLQMGLTPRGPVRVEKSLMRKQIEVLDERHQAASKEVNLLYDAVHKIEDLLVLDGGIENVIESIVSLCDRAPGTFERIQSAVLGHDPTVVAATHGALQEVRSLKSRLDVVEGVVNEQRNAIEGLISDDDTLTKAKAEVMSLTAKLAQADEAGVRAVQDYGIAQAEIVTLQEQRQKASENAVLGRQLEALQEQKDEELGQAAARVEAATRENEERVSRITADRDSLREVNDQLRADLGRLQATKRKSDAQLDSRLTSMMPNRKRRQVASGEELVEDLDDLERLMENLRRFLYGSVLFPMHTAWAAGEPDLVGAMESIQALQAVDLKCFALDWLKALPGLAKSSLQGRPCREQMFWLFAQSHRKDGQVSLDDICTLVAGMTDVGTVQVVLGLLQIFIQKMVESLTSVWEPSSNVSAVMILLRCIELFYRHLAGKNSMLHRVRSAFEQMRPVIDRVRSQSILIAGLADWLDDKLTLEKESWLAQKVAFHGRSKGRSITAGDHELLTDGDCLIILHGTEPNGPVHVCWPDSFSMRYVFEFRLVVRDFPTQGSDFAHTWPVTTENIQKLWSMFEPAFQRQEQREAAPQRVIFKAP